MNMLRAGIIAQRIDLTQQLFPGVAAGGLALHDSHAMPLRNADIQHPFRAVFGAWTQPRSSMIF